MSLKRINLNRNPTTVDALAENFRRLGSPVYDETPSGAINGVNTVFLLKRVPREGSLMIFAGGAGDFMQLAKTSAYAVDHATITFTTPPAAGTDIRAFYRE
jgi:hypothetical protein